MRRRDHGSEVRPSDGEGDGDSEGDGDGEGEGDGCTSHHTHRMSLLLVTCL